MKTQMKLMFGLLIVFAAAMAASAQTAPPKAEAKDDVTGKWIISLDAGGQNIDLTLDLTQKGTDFTGTMTSAEGSGTFEKGKVDAGKLTAMINSVVQGSPMMLTFNGKLEAGKMSGSLDVPNLGVFSFAGGKAK